MFASMVAFVMADPLKLAGIATLLHFLKMPIGFLPTTGQLCPHGIWRWCYQPCSMGHSKPWKELVEMVYFKTWHSHKQFCWLKEWPLTMTFQYMRSADTSGVVDAVPECCILPKGLSWLPHHSAAPFATKLGRWSMVEWTITVVPHQGLSGVSSSNSSPAL